MLSQNKGITLITLVITIIVLAILTTVSINVGYGTYKEMVVTGYVSRMNMIQSRVNVISQQIQQGDTCTQRKRQLLVDTRQLISESICPRAKQYRTDLYQLRHHPAERNGSHADTG